MAKRITHQRENTNNIKQQQQHTETKMLKSSQQQQLRAGRSSAPFTAAVPSRVVRSTLSSSKVSCVKEGMR